MPTKQRFKVRWTHTATQDLESIVDFIARDNVSASIQIMDRIRQTGSTLKAKPHRGRIVPELEEIGLRIYRELICPPWRIIYRISNANVFVMGVIDARRNVEDILLERFTR